MKDDTKFLPLEFWQLAKIDDGRAPLLFTEQRYDRMKACLNACAGIPTERLERKCECSLRTKCVGDGCDICNPRMALEYALENMKELEQQLDELQAKYSELLKTLEENECPMCIGTGTVVEGSDLDN